jgi:hypothetical protein
MEHIKGGGSRRNLSLSLCFGDFQSWWEMRR